MAVDDSSTLDGWAGAVSQRVRDRVSTADEHNNLMGYLLCLPNIVVFSAFMLGPVLYAFYISFHQWNILMNEGTWIGLANYIEVMKPLPWHNGWEPLVDPTANTFWWSLKTTAVYAIGTVPLQIYGGLAVALMLDTRVRGKKLYRAAYFMPMMLAGAASAVMWRWFLAADGIINSLLPSFLEHNWAGSPETALGGVMLMAVWGGIGGNMVFFLAGLQNIPEELYEAARIDGAGVWHRFRHVTWPSLGNTNFFVIVMGVISAFQVFGIALVFSKGGPYYATTTTVLLIYQRAFEEGAMGVGAAMAFLLFLVIFAFSYYQYRHRDQAEVDY